MARPGDRAQAEADALINETVHSRSALLDLSGLGLKELPPTTRMLAGRLTMLIVDNNQLTTLPGWIEEFTGLTTLSAEGNRIAALPEAVRALVGLKTLILGGNMIADLPDGLRGLRDLERLVLDQNRLTEIPQWVAELPSLTELAVNHNPLGDVLKEVARSGPTAVARYVKDRYADASGVQQWHAKVMLVGYGGAGKTSLVKSLMAEPFDAAEPMTRGMRLAEFSCPHPDLTDVTLRLVAWDLGGQDIFDSTHQLFMTVGSVVLLVCDGRRAGAEEANRWLDVVNDRIPGAPVLMVTTRANQHKPRIALADLRARYGQTVDLVSIDNSDGSGIEELRTRIGQIAIGLPSVGKLWPASWLKAAEALRRRPEETLPVEAAEQVLYDAGLLHRDSQTALLSTLHERGDLVYLRDTSRIAQHVILRPDWLNHAVYRLLDHAYRRGDAYVTREDLETVWAGRPYADRDLFLDTMAAFDLGWRLAGDRIDEAVFVVIQELPEQRTTAQAISGRGARSGTGVRVRYQFEGALPVGVPARFLARAQAFTTEALWRSGAVLIDGDNNILITATPERGTVDFDISGPTPYSSRSVLEAIFRNALPRSVQERLSVEILCPCGDHRARRCPTRHVQSHLGSLLDDGDEPVLCASGSRLRPSRLLFGIDAAGREERDTFAGMLVELKGLGTRIDGLGATLTAVSHDQRRLLTGQEVLAQGQIETCPSTFVIVPLGRGSRMLGSKMQLRLYCEAPSGQHPLPDGVGCYELKDPAPWLQKIGPWLIRASRVIKIAVPVAGALMGVADYELNQRKQADIQHMHTLLKVLGLENLDFERLDAQLHAADEVVKKAASVKVSAHTRMLPDAPRSQLPASHADSAADYRVLRELLKHVDPSLDWGGLNPHITAGETHYVCGDHLKALGGFHSVRDVAADNSM